MARSVKAAQPRCRAMCIDLLLEVFTHRIDQMRTDAL